MFSRNSKEVVKSKGTRGEKLDFDEEARKLFKSININPGEIGGEYNYLDPIWRHPTSGGVLYVGNQTAAQDLQIQATHKITHVVNCTADMPNYHEGKTGAMPKYYRFDVSNHWRYLNSRENSVQDFVAPLFRFIDEALTNGNGVLVHCLAGNKIKESFRGCWDRFPFRSACKQSSIVSLPSSLCVSNLLWTF